MVIETLDPYLDPVLDPDTDRYPYSAKMLDPDSMNSFFVLVRGLSILASGRSEVGNNSRENKKSTLVFRVPLPLVLWPNLIWLISSSVTDPDESGFDNTDF